MTKHAIDNIINALADFITVAIDTSQMHTYTSKIVFGPELPESCISMTPGPGAPTDIHLDKGMVYSLPVTINGKFTDQSLLLDTLYSIHELLTQRLDYAVMVEDDETYGSYDYQVIDIETTASPSIVGREQNKYWLAGSSVEVKFYWVKKQ